MPNLQASVSAAGPDVTAMIGGDYDEATAMAI